MGAGVLEPADLLCSRLFEIVFDDLYGIDLGRFANMLVHVVQHGLLLGLEVFEELVLCSLVPVEDVVVEFHEGDELSVPLHDQRLVHSAEVVDDLLDFLWIDVFAGWSQNHVVQTTFYIETSFLIHAGQVIGPEPAVI